jgi:hypothetical protein
LPKVFEKGLAALDIGRNSGRGDEQLASLCSGRISKHWRRNEALSMTLMLAPELRCSRCTDGAHRKMDSAGHQTLAKANEPNVFASEYDFASSVIVSQHADDNLTFEQPGEIRRRLKREGFKPVDLISATDVSDHTTSGGCKVCSHCSAHATETNKANVTQLRQTVD